MEFDKLKEIIASVLSVDVNEIMPDTTFVEDLGADSLDVFQIILNIENDFEIEINSEDAEKIKNVEEAVALIKSSMSRS